MKPCELVICVDVLCHKKWGRTLYNGQLKSQSWWERHKNALINTEATQIAKELLASGSVVENPPVPYEIEMGFGKPKEELPQEKAGL